MGERKVTLVWALGTAAFLFMLTLYLLLDSFVIVRSYSAVVESVSLPANTENAALDTAPNMPFITDTSYTDESLSIQLSTYRAYDSTVYVAEVILTDMRRFQTALAQNTYGRNVTEQTSSIAQAQGALLAINGDYYGAQRSGYVIRNGVLYRESVKQTAQEDLCIWPDGSFSIIKEGDVTAQALLEQGVLQVLSFGPALVEGGEISVAEGDEVGQAMTSNPRTAIAIAEPLHYFFVVADGRTAESNGLSLYQLAAFLQDLGAQTAYNLDGGGSSTMVFMDEVVNYPTTSGRYSERAVSDIVYVN
ncbi:MAG: phosphodiester glycosidase family protein [Eubacteriales bacterium]|nr:phosphodiester glycosidase family protein [Eubacteriales bacterium]